MVKVVNINESQYQRTLLNEGISKVLYHFTSINHGYRICKDDKIYLQSAFSKDSDDYDKKRKFYLSCTRIRNSQFGYSKKFSEGGVRIAFDGDALSTRYKGKQVNYWGGGTFTDKFKYAQNVEKDREEPTNAKAYNWRLNRWKKEHPNASQEEIDNWIAHNFYDDAQHHVSNESEDRIFSYDPLIVDAHKYIKSVDVLLIDFENDPQKMALAQSFLYKTMLGGKYVKIFDSEKEFNNPNGKDANDKVEYGYGYIEDNRPNLIRARNCLSAVICFIAYANNEFDEKNFPKKVAEYITRYELGEFKNQIGAIINDFKHNCGGIRGIAEKLDACRRDLSDNPNEYTYKISKMLTDYCLSIGAYSFREAYLIKKDMEAEYYSLNAGKAYDRIDTNAKYNFLILNDHIISLNPRKDKFADAIGWDDEECKYNADTFASEIMYYGNEKYSFTSKNNNSMFQYLYKLFRSGSILDVYNVLKKIGFDDEYLDSWGIKIQYKDLDYWDAVRYDTVNTIKLKVNDYDYMSVSRKKDKEIENYFKAKQKAQ